MLAREVLVLRFSSVHCPDFSAGINAFECIVSQIFINGFIHFIPCGVIAKNNISLCCIISDGCFQWFIEKPLWKAVECIRILCRCKSIIYYRIFQTCVFENKKISIGNILVSIKIYSNKNAIKWVNAKRCTPKNKFLRQRPDRSNLNWFIRRVLYVKRLWSCSVSNNRIKKYGYGIILCIRIAGMQNKDY